MEITNGIFDNIFLRRNYLLIKELDYILDLYFDVKWSGDVAIPHWATALIFYFNYFIVYYILLFIYHVLYFNVVINHKKMFVGGGGRKCV